MLVEIAGVIIAGAVVVGTVSLVSAVRQIGRTLHQSERLLHTVNQALPGLLQEARQAVQNMNQAAGDVHAGLTQVRLLSETVGSVRGSLQTLLALRPLVAGLMASGGKGGTGFLAGFQETFRFFQQRAQGAKPVHDQQGGSRNGG